jgi:hypothetical protein
MLWFLPITSWALPAAALYAYTAQALSAGPVSAAIANVNCLNQNFQN